MTHRAEQIMAAVHAAVTGLLTTGANAVRARGDSVAIDAVPALSVWQGVDTVESELSHNQQICTLEINIDAVVAEVATLTDTALAQIRAEVTVALAADYTLGLDFVYSIREVQADDPEPVGEGDRPASRQRLRWEATYRRSRIDPSI